MKKSLFRISMFAMAAVLLLSGCTQAQESSPIDVTVPADAPTASPSQLQGDSGDIHEELLLPQDVPEEEAVYRLSYTAPAFGTDADQAIAEYLDELYTRVTSERMPYADAVDSLPYTAVTYEIQQAELSSGTYTNVIFTEEYSFGDDVQQELHIIVLDPHGSECSLAAASGAYFPEDMAVQQVLNVVAYDPSAYYGDLTADTVLSALDLYNGFTVADEGYTLFIPAGAIAPEENGMVEISFPRRALYPGFVGDVMDEDVYEALLPALSASAAACGPEFSGFSGPPTGELAASIMNEYFLAQGVEQVSASEYAAAYRAIFGVDINAADTAISDAGLPAFGVQWEDAFNEGDAITLTGQLMSGEPGSGSAAPAATVSATVRNTESGWILEEFEIM